jgi:hypothetical protein
LTSSSFSWYLVSIDVRSSGKKCLWFFIKKAAKGLIAVYQFGLAGEKAAQSQA